jgi:hypothetical protein
MVHQPPTRSFLRDLEDIRKTLYSLVVEKMGHGRPTATVRIGRPSTAVGAGLLLQAMNRRGGPWQGGSMMVD